MVTKAAEFVRYINGRQKSKRSVIKLNISINYEEQQSKIFFKMPKVLFTERYKGLSAEAKLLYGLMLDRMQLSTINGWCDKNGEIFIFFTISKTSEILGCGHDKATKLQRELEKYNLLRRKYQGKGKPAKLYVLTVPKISAECA